MCVLLVRWTWMWNQQTWFESLMYNFSGKERGDTWMGKYGWKLVLYSSRDCMLSLDLIGFFHLFHTMNMQLTLYNKKVFYVPLLIERQFLFYTCSNFKFYDVNFLYTYILLYIWTYIISIYIVKTIFLKKLKIYKLEGKSSLYLLFTQ
jgi:hypothetical protein